MGQGHQTYQEPDILLVTDPGLYQMHAHLRYLTQPSPLPAAERVETTNIGGCFMYASLRTTSAEPPQQGSVQLLHMYPGRRPALGLPIGGS